MSINCHTVHLAILVFLTLLSKFLYEILLIHQLKKLLGNSNTSKKKDEPKSCLEEGCLAQGSVIVYVWRQRDTEVVAENLMASGIEGGVVLYHGGMDSNARAKAQSKVRDGT